MNIQEYDGGKNIDLNFSRKLQFYLYMHYIIFKSKNLFDIYICSMYSIKVCSNLFNHYITLFEVQNLNHDAVKRLMYMDFNKRIGNFLFYKIQTTTKGGPHRSPEQQL